MRVKKVDHEYYGFLSDPVYPRCKVNGRNPYDEQIMSMPSVLSQRDCSGGILLPIPTKEIIRKGFYFFFIFNFENYYHFLYDTLPYLHFYFKQHFACKILLPKDHKWLRFQREFFDLLGIQEKDIRYAEDGVYYEHLYIPTSLTHGHLDKWEYGLYGSKASNFPPEPEAYAIWNSLHQESQNKTYPKKIYISRRTWLLEDMSNIGTNYTTRRKCMNEDALVEILKGFGYEEVFCESLNTVEKIELFQNVTHVVGFIGGGMANLLFSKPETKVCCILTPEFIRINERFKHSMNHTQVTYLDATKHSDYIGKYPLYTRVKVLESGKIGELTGVSLQHENLSELQYSIQVATEAVAGFSLNGSYETVVVYENQIEALDGGLNSPFTCDIDSIKNICEKE